MGWSTTQRLRNNEFDTDERFVMEQLMGDNFVLHGIASIPDNKDKGVIYAAMSNVDKPEEVFAFIMRYEWNDSDRHNYAFNYWSDECGPGYHKCPGPILDLLSPTENQNALAWRQQCRMNAGQPLLAMI